MRKLSLALAGLLAIGLATPAPAHAYWRGGYGGYGGGYGGWHRGWGGPRPGFGLGVAAGVLGLGAAAVIASQPHYYYPPPPVVVAPPPPPVVYHPGYYEQAPGYYGY